MKMDAIRTLLIMASVTAGSAGGEERFAASPGGIVSDFETGLDWMVGPDRDMDWEEANAWISSLGEPWRMPSQTELQELMDAGITYESWGLFENGGVWVWSTGTDSVSPQWLFDFDGHREGWFYPRSHATYERAFAVRRSSRD
jgi:hypothetical protein